MDRCIECNGWLWPWGRSRLRLQTHRKCYDDATTRDFVTRYERRLILAAKRNGATEYVFVDLDQIPGEGELKGENMALHVREKWPGAIHDPDKSTNKTWAFLLPHNAALTDVLGAVRVTSATLVGVFKDKYPLQRGNCFSVLADDGKEYRVVNFVHENLEEVCRRGISFPIAMRRISERVAIFHDGRIPDEWYSDRFCETCCPEPLLPMPQRLAHERQEMQGVRTAQEQCISYDYGKRPTLKAPNT